MLFSASEVRHLICVFEASVSRSVLASQGQGEPSYVAVRPYAELLAGNIGGELLASNIGRGGLPSNGGQSGWDRRDEEVNGSEKPHVGGELVWLDRCR